MTLPPSEINSSPQVGGEVSDQSGDLDRAADEYMRRAARLDPVGFKRIAARYPTRSLRSLNRPRSIRVDGRLVEIMDVPIDEARDDDSPASEYEKQQYREWLQGQGIVP